MNELASRDRAGVGEASAGYTVEASSAAVAFLWDHWDVVFKIGGSRIRTEQLSSDSWKGVGLWGSGEWFRTHRSAAINSGRYEFLTIGKLFGVGFRSQTACEYRRIDDRTITYFGRTTYSVPRLLSPFRGLMDLASVRVLSYVNHVGANAATAITQDPGLVARAAGDAAHQLFEAYVAEENALRRGARGTYKYFTPSADHAPDAIDPEIAELRRDLRRLEDIVSRAHAPLDIRDYQASLNAFPTDPVMALMRNRVIVERIARLIFETETGQRAEKRPLSEIVVQLADSARVPDSIIALINTVISLGDVGAGASGSDVPQRDALQRYDDFSMSFPATLRVTEWFVVEYLKSTRRPQPNP